MHYKVMLAVIIIGVAVLITGCRGAKETDNVAFIIMMGIDKADQDKIKVTYQIVIPRAVGGLQSTGQEVKGGPVITNSIVASNTAEAHNLLSSTMSRYANITQMQGIIISEEMARSGVGDTIAPLVRYREYRGSMYVYIVRGRAEEFLEKSKPKLDYIPAKWAETFMVTANESSYYSGSKVHDFYLRLKNPGGSPYAAYIGLNPLTGEDRPADEKLSNEKADSYLPMGMPRTGTGDIAEFVGTAVFSGDKMVGALDTRETRILRILQNKYPHGFFIVADPLEPQKEININMSNGSKPEIQVDMIDGQEVIKIKIFLEGEITSIASGINYEKEEYRVLLENSIANLVTQEAQKFIRHTQELGSDVFGFGYYLRPHFTTYEELENTNLEELYKTANVEVQVTTKLRRTGLMWRSSPYKPTTTPTKD